MTLIKSWDESHRNGKKPGIVTFDHGLAETGLFTDDALADLLDYHPTEMVDVRTRSQDAHPQYPGMLRTGDFRDVSGRDLIAAAKEGWIWINMRQVMNIQPDYKKVLDDMYAEYADLSGVKVYNPKGGLLITSPVARTPYHCDKAEVVLWHIRGKKRIYVYPVKEEFIADKDYEDLLTNPANDDLPYSDDFDAHADVMDLKEGQAITWPLNAPHRVENSTFCVSVTTEFSTKKSALKNAAMIANKSLRDRFGHSGYYSDQNEANRLMRSVFGRVIKKTAKVGQSHPADIVSFKVDPSAPGFIVDIPPFERNF